RNSGSPAPPETRSPGTSSPTQESPPFSSSSSASRAIPASRAISSSTRSAGSLRTASTRSTSSRETATFFVRLRSEYDPVLPPISHTDLYADSDQDRRPRRERISRRPRGKRQETQSLLPRHGASSRSPEEFRPSLRRNHGPRRRRPAHQG